MYLSCSVQRLAKRVINRSFQHESVQWKDSEINEKTCDWAKRLTNHNRSLLQNMVSFIGLICKRDLRMKKLMNQWKDLRINVRKSIKDPIKWGANKQVMRTTRLFENSRVKWFWPVSHGFVVPAECINIYILFSKVTEDFRYLECSVRDNFFEVDFAH